MLQQIRSDTHSIARLGERQTAGARQIKNNLCRHCGLRRFDQTGVLMFQSRLPPAQAQRCMPQRPAGATSRVASATETRMGVRERGMGTPPAAKQRSGQPQPMGARRALGGRASGDVLPLRGCHRQRASLPRAPSQHSFGCASGFGLGWQQGHLKRRAPCACPSSSGISGRPLAC